MRPLKILHVANRAEKKNSRQFYALPNKINNGLIRNGHNVVWFSDRDISRALAPFRSQKLGKKACNRSLMEVCNNFKPDLILLGHADLISPETIDRIRSTNKQVKVAQYNIDALFVPNNIKKIHSKSEVVDFTFCTTAGPILKKIATGRSAAAFIPNPIDPSIEIHRNFLSNEQKIDVFFAGQISDIGDPLDIRNSVSQLSRYFPQKKIKILHSIWGSEYIKALGEAKIGLSLSTSPIIDEQTDIDGFYMYSSDRISQYLGNGLLTITNRAFSMAELYGDDCLYEVSDMTELVQQIEYNLSHPDKSQRVAKNAWKFVHAHFNEKLVTRFMVETIFEEGNPKQYHWPTKIWR